MNITIDPLKKIPAYLQIKSEIASLVKGGKLKAGERLPATRDLAKQLGINRGTVTTAYDELIADGLLESYIGKGTFVTISNKSIQNHSRKYTEIEWDGLFSENTENSIVRSLLDLYQVSTISDVISFSGSFPDTQSFPLQDFRNSLNYAIRTLGAKVFQYGPAVGMDQLREYLSTEMKNLECKISPEEILITNGSQQALDLLARTFISPGDTVILENPTYPGAVSAFTLAGARLIGIPVDSEGLQTNRLEQILMTKQPKFIYVIPNFQNPTGICLSQNRKNHLLALASKYNIPIIEDDYGAGLYFNGETILPLKANDFRNQVVYIRSFSKSLMPGLRIGWCAAPIAVINRLIALKQNTDMSTSALLQIALWDFCRRKKYQNHLEHMRLIYRKRCNRVIEILEKEFPPDTKWTNPKGGLFLWITLPKTIDTTELLLQVRQKGVTFSRGHLFYIGKGESNTLRLSYGNATLQQIEMGLRIIGKTTYEMKKRGDKHSPDKFTTHTLPLV